MKQFGEEVIMQIAVLEELVHQYLLFLLIDPQDDVHCHPIQAAPCLFPSIQPFRGGLQTVEQLAEVVTEDLLFGSRIQSRTFDEPNRGPYRRPFVIVRIHSLFSSVFRMESAEKMLMESASALIHRDVFPIRYSLVHGGDGWIAVQRASYGLGLIADEILVGVIAAFHDLVIVSVVVSHDPGTADHLQ